MISNVLYSVNNNLCTGCGICEDICHKKAIIIVRENGIYRPIVDSKTCLGDKCGRCLKICPGIGENYESKSSILFNDSIDKNKYIGNYVSLHTGYSLDEHIRIHSASGGIVSQFLIYLLEKKIIDGAIVTAFGPDKITPYCFIARTKEDILRAKSSKYCPVSMNKVGNEIVKQSGKFVIVGLPCHITGFRKRASIDAKFKERILGYFSIYCSSNRTFNAQDYLLRKYGVDKKTINYFAYRDNGCLGNLTIEKKDNNTISVPFEKYYGQLRSFFKPHRCLTCIDHYGYLADVCFGDIHIFPYSNDKVGVSSWIVRTKYWNDLFNQASTDGYIHIDSLDAKTLNESQKIMLYPKQRRAKAVMNMDKLIGRETPKYDLKLDSPTYKDYCTELLCHIQRYIGSHTCLWWVIDLLNKK